jgi:hypothetical protein
MSVNAGTSHGERLETHNESNVEVHAPELGDNQADTSFVEVCLAVVQEYRKSRCSRGDAMGRLFTLGNDERGCVRPELVEHVEPLEPV